MALLHSYANPAHEQIVAEIIERLAPEIETSVSHRVLPEAKEYERTSTTVVNACLKPVVSRYLAGLEEGFAGIGTPRAAAVDAVEWRAHAFPGGAQPAHAHRRIRAGRRGNRSAGAGPGRRPRKCPYLRHGRHHGQGVHRRARRSLARARIQRGRRGYRRLAADDRVPVMSSRRRPSTSRKSAPGAVRCSAWTPPAPCRSGRKSAGADPGTCLLRRGRNRTDPHRLPTCCSDTSIRAILSARRAQARFRGSAEGLRALHRGADGARAGRCRAGRPPHRRLEHDPRHPRRLFGARARPARLCAVRLRRQRARFSPQAWRANLPIKRVLVPPSPGAVLVFRPAPCRGRTTTTPTRIGASCAAPTRQNSKPHGPRWRRRRTNSSKPTASRRTRRTLARSAQLHYHGQIFELQVAAPPGRVDAAWIAALEESFGVEHERTYGHRAGPEEPVELMTAQGRRARPLP